MHRFGKRGMVLVAVLVVGFAVGASAAFGTASAPAHKARSAKATQPVCAKAGGMNVPAFVQAKLPANCNWLTGSAPSAARAASTQGLFPVGFRSIGALVGTGGGNTCTVGVSGIGVVCTDLGGGTFEIDFPARTYDYPTLGIPTTTPFGAGVDTLGFVEFLNLDGSASLFILLSADVTFTFTNTAGHF